MERDLSGVVIALLFVICHVQSFDVNEFASCEETKINYQMSGKMIKNILVYTPLQCQDQCFRTNSCDGFNLNLERHASNHLSCQLMEANSTSKLIQKSKWMYKKLNRTGVAKLWVESPCKGCGEGQACHRTLDICGKEQCQCEYGRIDNGCFGSGILTSDQGKILTPTFMQSECNRSGNTGKIAEAYTCFYFININDTRNISIEFTTFKLKDGSFRDCDVAKQIMALIPASTMQENRYCGQHPVPIKTKIFAKRISIMFEFKRNTNACIEIAGNYTVL